MKEMTFEIDAETGEVTVHVKGQPGKACLDAHSLVEALLGEAAETTLTREYYQGATTTKGGRVKVR